MLTPEQMEAKLKEFGSTLETQKKDFDTKLETQKKDFELKLESANREAESWKSNAKAREEQVKKYEQDLEAAKKEAEVANHKAKAQDLKAFADKLKREAKITPAQEETIVKLMESMTSEATIATFKEKDGSTRAHNQLSLFKQFLESLSAKGTFSQHTYGSPITVSTPEGEDQATESFMEVKSKSGGTQKLPVMGLDLDQAAEKYMEDMRAKGKVVTYSDALIAVSPKKKVSA